MQERRPGVTSTYLATGTDLSLPLQVKRATRRRADNLQRSMDFRGSDVRPLYSRQLHVQMILGHG
jgi:hypothetical protein